MWTIEGALRAIARQDPLTVSPETTLRELLVRIVPLLEQRGDDAVVIVDPASELPLGVLTTVDLLRLIGLDGVIVDSPVVSLMTAGVATVPADSPIQRAATLMVRRNVRYLVLVETDGRFFGLVSQSDLYSIQTGQVDALVRSICLAPDIDTLAVRSTEARALAGRLLDGGWSPSAICHWLSTLNDLVVLQAIDLIEPLFDLPVIPWCWLLFGSEGRYEQTLLTDQDNGLLFVPAATESDALAAETERCRQAFLPFAKAVNAALDRCGFPLCSGDIMASNPKWCLSLSEWQDAFIGWMRQPEPEALLNASIFFDFRSIYGPEEPVQRLRDTLFQEALTTPLCPRLMAVNALDVAPPLGRWWSDFRYDDKAYPGTIDLKKYGSRLFVDVARVLALAEGIPATGTVPRLREVASRLRWPLGEVSGFIDAFYVLQRLRLSHQHRLSRHDPEQENRVAPDQLNEIDRHLLREALQQAKQLQQRVRSRWQLE